MSKTEPATTQKTPVPSSGSPEMPQVPKDMPLIPVTQGQVGGIAGLVVDARSLHEALGVKRDFTTWIKGRIEDYEFVESENYDIFDSPDLVNQVHESRGGDRRSKKYTLTLHMAKELAMVERNAMGRAVRKYFIQCEKNLLASVNAAHPQAQPQVESKKAQENVPGERNLLRDFNGKPFEKSAEQRHGMFLAYIFAEIPRKMAYEEYARTLAIVGESKKQVAEQVAECLYHKLYRECGAELLKDMASIYDLSLLKEIIKKKLEK